jgi:hypothetical protein
LGEGLGKGRSVYKQPETEVDGSCHSSQVKLAPMPHPRQGKGRTAGAHLPPSPMPSKPPPTHATQRSASSVATMEGGSPIIMGAQRELIEKHAALLGEDGKAIIQDIEEEAGKAGKLPADVFRLIDSCLHALGQRAMRQELSNEVIKEREPERLVQVEAIREHATRLIGVRASGDNAALESVKQAMLGLVEKFMADVNRDKEDGLDPDTARAWKDQVYEIVDEAKLAQDGGGGDGADRWSPRNQRTAWPLSGRPLGLRPTPWRLWRGRSRTLTRPRYGDLPSTWGTRRRR